MHRLSATESAAALLSLIERNGPAPPPSAESAAARAEHHRRGRGLPPGVRGSHAGHRGRGGRSHRQGRVVRVSIVRAGRGRARARGPVRGQSRGPEDPANHAGHAAVARRTEILRQEAGAEQQGAPGLCFGRVTRPARAIAEDPGLQRPAQVQMRRRRSTTRDATTSTGSRTRRGECRP